VYAEKPLHVCKREIFGFGSTRKTNHGVEGGDEESGATVRIRILRRGTRDRQGRDVEAIFVSNFRLETTQEELSEALEQLGKYERLVMCMSLKRLGFLSELTI